uniref:Uncharacterized protein n=1 Tax=Arundo donax TaxID=35708 RepID=A0A0A9FRE1_ARUDO
MQPVMLEGSLIKQSCCRRMRQKRSLFLRRRECLYHICSVK